MQIYMDETAPIHYNNEQALRSVIKLAYFAYSDYYIRFEELPSGRGYADMVYLPRKASDMPVLIIELKWDKTADTALDQIRRKSYARQFESYGAGILLVGISYDKDDDDKRHHCVIERIEG